MVCAWPADPPPLAAMAVASPWRARLRPAAVERHWWLILLQPWRQLRRQIPKAAARSCQRKRTSWNSQAPLAALLLGGAWGPWRPWRGPAGRCTRGAPAPPARAATARAPRCAAASGRLRERAWRRLGGWAAKSGISLVGKCIGVPPPACARSATASAAARSGVGPAREASAAAVPLATQAKPAARPPVPATASLHNPPPQRRAAHQCPAPATAPRPHRYPPPPRSAAGPSSRGPAALALAPIAPWPRRYAGRRRRERRKTA
mmetsp:Transcript_79168/g.232424  ORF Transcript_79168/g.232424 Transcript_79168/m.232424 type:complete len:262 (+) Transcript_79168:461-1246(+)